MNNAKDPLAEAEVYIAYGRNDQAVRILEAAIRKDPTRADLQSRLKSIKSQFANLNPEGKVRATRSRVLVHAVAVYVIFIAMALVLTFSCRLLVTARFTLPDPTPLVLLGGVILMMVVSVLFLAIYIVILLAYFKTFVSEEDMTEIESKFNNFQRYEPIYSWIKKHVYHC